MNRGLKILLLSFILLIPAAIYVFLQVFGQNEFSLPVYRIVEELDVLIAVEGQEADGMMLYPGKSVERDRASDQYSLTGTISIVEFITSEDDPDRRNRQIRRIADMFAGESSLRIIRIFETGVSIGTDKDPSFVTGNDNVRTISSSYDGMLKYATEGLGMYVDSGQHKKIDQLVLLDREGRIRGYYTSTEFEEMDRLVLELKILLKKDQNV